MTKKKREGMTADVHVSCKLSEKFLWIKKAEKQGLFLSEWIRRTLNKEAKKAK